MRYNGTPKYNGHPSYQHWNAALWISNDESLYKIARHMNREQFVEYINESFPRTPDGVEMTEALIRYAWKCANEE